MAEWSKALVSDTSHFDGVVSNPTTAICAGRFGGGKYKTFLVYLKQLIWC